MRANVNLEAEAYRFASAYANAKGITLGAAISELLRRVEQTTVISVGVSSGLKTTPRGYFAKAKRGLRITSEMVRESAEDDLA